VRAWVAGCSTGEEAYSCAILLRECLERLGKPLEVQIFATDLDGRAIETARQGRYPVGIAADVSPQRLAHFFVEEAGGYQVRKEIREMLVFATQDVLGDPPFTRVDLVSCRNLLIYLGADRQRWVLGLLHYALNPGGLLLLGTSESTTVVEELFAPVDRRWKLYRRRQTASRPITTLPNYRPTVGLPRIATLQATASEGASPLLARTFAPPSVLVNDRGEVVHVHGRTGSFLEPAEGRASPMNVLEMAREGLRPALTSLLREAALGPARREVRIVASGEERVVSVVARRIPPPDPLAGLVLVSFEDPVLAHDPATDAGSRGGAPVAATAPRATSAPATELEQARRDLQATVEELQTSNEELASSNEEVQATNVDRMACIRASTFR
jgi:two-component system CheB/CheR fusion protein